MIKPEELRIGNITSHGVVIRIAHDSFSVERKYTWFSSDANEIEGVPLTEELLVKAGFVGNEYLRKDGFIFAIWKRANGFYLCVSEDDDDCIEIKYFHHIQNICRDFGTELTIKI